MSSAIFNKSKIIATIGPSSMDTDTLEKMIKVGMDVVRINASHGDHKMHRIIVDNIRKLNAEKRYKIPVLYDLQGPKLRIGEVKDNAADLVEGAAVRLTIHPCEGTAALLHVHYTKFYDDVQQGDPVLIDDGKVELLVIGKEPDGVVLTKVVHGGVVSSRKGINLPFTKLSLPCLSDKDLQDLEFALDNHIEWIGLSFVRTAQDILELKSRIAARKMKTRVVAKIEKPEALRDLDNIIQAADAIMVARGDLGVEIAMEKVPVIQKNIVRKAISYSKPVIIATQMMESMITNYRPTRAEASDVANAVFDGADALMLSGETSVGAYPVKVVEAMAKIIGIAETEDFIFNKQIPPIKNSKSFISDSICYSACAMAQQSGAAGIIAMTNSGYTAFRISSQRPRSHVFIFTDNMEMLTTLNLVWGVRAFHYDRYESSEDTITDIKAFLKKRGLVKDGDLLINVFSTPLESRGMANTIKLHVI
ncbi:MAG: pyruvate kinase [Bacteroidota bacterium]